MTRALIWTLRALGGLVVLLALVLGGAVWWLRGSLPETEGTVATTRSRAGRPPQR